MMTRDEGTYSSAEEALNKATALYQDNINFLLDGYRKFHSDDSFAEEVQAYYPEITIKISKPPQLQDRTQSYGYCVKPGFYSTTFTAPETLRAYFQEQLERILVNHPKAKISVKPSDIPIPLPFALGYLPSDEKEKIKEEKVPRLKEVFDFPDPEFYPNRVVSAQGKKSKYPLAWYNGPRTDRSLQRLKHYTGTDPRFFQKYILFTNYHDYIHEFRKFAQNAVTRKGAESYMGFVQPGNIIQENKTLPSAKEYFEGMKGKKPNRLPQMPAYHLVKEGGMGISIVNIGVGPSNAKTITDELAVLRPNAWLMVGHCAGLSHAQNVGDYVLPNGFILKDGLMELKLGNDVDIPELSEIHTSMTDAIKTVLDVEGEQYKESVRTGIVTTVADRNWEAPDTLKELRGLMNEFGKNNSFALDMETGTICANGVHHHVPYGAILCVSDKPLHFEPKLPDMAQNFYRNRVSQQFNIAVECINNLRKMGDHLHSRKLRSDFAYVPFR